MDCPRCHRTVPDDSMFCLHCGLRLHHAERLVPVNGGGAPRPGSEAAAEPAGPPPSPVPPGAGGKRPYAVSFKALNDERLRYRVARWVCEVAPVHPLAEVQESLTRGDFATFLAFTPEEAEAARQRVQALGVHPALLHLAPATDAELLLPPRRKPAERDTASWTTRQKFAVVGVAVAILFVFGLVMLRIYGG